MATKGTKHSSIGKVVIVTTSFRGCYFGTLLEHGEDDSTCRLTDARMVIRYGTTEGADQLAATGPTGSSKLGAWAPVVWLCGLTSVVECTPAAAAVWGKP